MRKSFEKCDEGGEGSISVESFTAVMGAFKLKGSVLQTAIAHSTYVS